MNGDAKELTWEVTAAIAVFVIRTAHSSPAAQSSNASSTANGKRVSPLSVAGMRKLVHSASSRSAG